MINLSSAMGGQFAFSAAEMTAEIKRMGPNPLRNADDGPRSEAGQGCGLREGEPEIRNLQSAI